MKFFLFLMFTALVLINVSAWLLGDKSRFIREKVPTFPLPPVFALSWQCTIIIAILSYNYVHPYPGSSGDMGSSAGWEIALLGWPLILLQVFVLSPLCIYRWNKKRRVGAYLHGLIVPALSVLMFFGAMGAKR